MDLVQYYTCKFYVNLRKLQQSVFESFLDFWFVFHMTQQMLTVLSDIYSIYYSSPSGTKFCLTITGGQFFIPLGLMHKSMLPSAPVNICILFFFLIQFYYTKNAIPLHIFISTCPSPGWRSRSWRSGLYWMMRWKRRKGSQSQPTILHCLWSGIPAMHLTFSKPTFKDLNDHGLTNMGFPIWIVGELVHVCDSGIKEYASTWDLDLISSFWFLTYLKRCLL